MRFGLRRDSHQDNDLPDIEIVEIAGEIRVDQFYDLGVALGFTITELDHMEYRRLRDRQEATIDMLLKWKKDQGTNAACTDLLRVIQNQLEEDGTPVLQDSTGIRDIDDATLVSLARQIPAGRFMDVGQQLGFNKTELQHIEHRTIYNRKDANIQMLSAWKKSQGSGQEAMRALKSVWESVQQATGPTGESENSELDVALTESVEEQTLAASDEHFNNPESVSIESSDDNTYESASSDSHLTPTESFTQQQSGERPQYISMPVPTEFPLSDDRADESASGELQVARMESFTEQQPVIGEEDVDIPNTPHQKYALSELILVDLHDKTGGSPSSQELFIVCRSLENLDSVCQLAERLGVSDASTERSVQRNLSDQSSGDVTDNVECLSGQVVSDAFLLHVPQLISSASSDVADIASLMSGHFQHLATGGYRPLHLLQMSSNHVTPYRDVIRSTSLRVLQSWLQSGGTREALLCALQSLGFVDAAQRIASAMSHHPSLDGCIGFAALNHEGGDIDLDNRRVNMYVSEGAIREGPCVLLTLRAPCSELRFPFQEGEFQVTPAVQCSPLSYDLQQAVYITLPHCIDMDRFKTVPQLFLHSKTKEGNFTRRPLILRGHLISKMKKNSIEFEVNQLQSFVVSARTRQGLKLKCVCFHPLYMPPNRRPDLHVYLIHHLPQAESVISKAEKFLRDFYSQAITIRELSFTTTGDDIIVHCNDGLTISSRKIRLTDVCLHDCIKVSFELNFTNWSIGIKRVNISVEQGPTVSQGEFRVKIEDADVESELQGSDESVSPGGPLTDDVIDMICDTAGPDWVQLAYQLGFYHSAVREYQRDVEADEDASGCRRMLLDWLRKVRPSQQPSVLRKALVDSGLQHVEQAAFSGDM